MPLEFLHQGGDSRGTILFFQFNQTKTNLFEIKKGFARGGHYHNYDIIHTLISGKIEHRTKHLHSDKEEIEIICAPAIMKIPANTANLIIALDDSLFSEIFNSEYKSTAFKEYRDIVLQKMKDSVLEKNTLKIINQLEDARGKIFFFEFNKKNINLIEIKKGFARGGHYHNFDSEHIGLSGKIRYLEKNLATNIENEKIIVCPEIVFTSSQIAHMFIGLDDSIFVESFSDEYEATYYPSYRNFIDEKIKSNT